jgi:hypothetical protein
LVLISRFGIAVKPKTLSVQEIIALQKICLGDSEGVEDNVQNSLREKNVLPKPNVLSEDHYTETAQKTAQKTTQALSIKQQEILNYLSTHPSASRKEISENISGISEDGVKYNLKF